MDANRQPSQTSENSPIDYFEGRAFHPSLDMKDDILVIGFRIKPRIDEEENLFLIACGGNTWITRESRFEIDGKNHEIDLKKRKLVKLASRWSLNELNKFTSSSTAMLNSPIPSVVFDKIRSTLKRYIELDEVDETIIVAWIIGTYYFPLFSATPYLHIKAPKGSGKTQFLSFIKMLAFNAVKTRGSLPAVRDTLDTLRGTLLIDQADALRRPNSEDLLDTLTDSYKRGGGEARKMLQDKTKNWSPEEFQAYAPKAFASIHPIPEDLRDRCIIINLTKSSKNFEHLNEEDAIWADLRGDLYKLLITTFDEIGRNYKVAAISYRHNPTISGRPLELWLPLEIIMQRCAVNPGDLSAARSRFLGQYRVAEPQISLLDEEVLKVVMERLRANSTIIFLPKEISELVSDEAFEGDYVSSKQKAAEVGKVINKFNLFSQKLPRSNKGERYEFTRERVEKIYQAYFAQQIEDTPTQTYTEEKEPSQESVFSVNAESG